MCLEFLVSAVCAFDEEGCVIRYPKKAMKTAFQTVAPAFWGVFHILPTSAVVRHPVGFYEDLTILCPETPVRWLTLSNVCRVTVKKRMDQMIFNFSHSSIYCECN